MTLREKWAASPVPPGESVIGLERRLSLLRGAVPAVGGSMFASEEVSGRSRMVSVFLNCLLEQGRQAPSYRTQLTLINRLNSSFSELIPPRPTINSTNRYNFVGYWYRAGTWRRAEREVATLYPPNHSQ